ncbi:MAG TPA: hypothetical protein VMS64_13340, partial [Candidatus Methylomirabilis sp.]|nr:hypothetical protein [Candidatus Methylomirabilis sp.]
SASHLACARSLTISGAGRESNAAHPDTATANPKATTPNLDFNGTIDLISLSSGRRLVKIGRGVKQIL